MKRLTNEQFVEKAKNIHFNKYDYSKTEYIKATSKVSIFCNNCKTTFTQLPINHLSDKGCYNCYGNHRKTNKQIINEFKNIHKNNYNYELVEYNNAFTKVKIKCLKCTDYFSQTPHDHLSGKRCPACYGTHKKTNEEIINDFKNIHGDKYNYDNIDYVNAHTKVEILCNKCNQTFFQTPTKHLDEHGCAKCCSSSISKISSKWLDILNVVEREKTIKINNKFYKVDGYDSVTNTIYEFYGDFWHGNPKIYKSEDVNIRCKKSFGELHKNTIIRENELLKLGYNIIFIWESDFYKKYKDCIKSVKNKINL